MKRKKLIKYLEDNGAKFFREGKNIVYLKKMVLKLKYQDIVKLRDQLAFKISKDLNIKSWRTNK